MRANVSFRPGDATLSHDARFPLAGQWEGTGVFRLFAGFLPAKRGSRFDTKPRSRLPGFATNQGTKPALASGNRGAFGSVGSGSEGLGIGPAQAHWIGSDAPPLGSGIAQAVR